MLQITNLTPFAVDRAITIDPNGAQVWVVAIKATFLIGEDGSLQAAPEDAQEPVCLGPEYFGEPGRSSLRRECELVYTHPGTDVIVNANAHAPAGERRRELLCGVKVGPIQKAVRVHGERRWEEGLNAPVPSVAEPFETMPIRYERAFGGTLAAAGEGPALDWRNPVGTGLHREPGEILGELAPSVEDPDRPVTAAHAGAEPAGLGIVAPNWQPRSARVGTCDDTWRKNRMPFLPEDFDPKFFCCAASGMTTDEPLSGGEPVELVNLTKGGLLSFRLPSLRFIVHTLLNGQRINGRVVMDRVIIEPEDRRVILVWRSSLECGSQARRIKKSIVAPKPRIRV